MFYILSSCLLTSRYSSQSLHNWATIEPYVRTNSSALTLSTLFHVSSAVFERDIKTEEKCKAACQNQLVADAHKVSEENAPELLESQVEV